MGTREEFEKLCGIAEILKDEDTHWCDKRGMYINQRVFQDSTTGYLNGAWYAFQEQQKKINEAKKEINNFFDNQTQKPTDREYCNKLADILELLK